MALTNISTETALKALTKLKDNFKSILDTAKKDLKGSFYGGILNLSTESPESFSSEGIWKTDFLSDVYGDAYQSLGIKTRKEYEKFFLADDVKREKDLLNAYLEIKKLENDFDELMKELDESMGFPAVNIPQVEELAPSASLLHVPSKREHVQDVARHADKFQQLGVKVIVMSAGTFDGAIKWKELVQCPFDILVDEQGEIFKSFGLEKSYVRGWSMETLLFFADRRAVGIPCTNSQFEIQEMDSLQDGGDFILDNGGRIAFAHATANPMDRPTAEKLLEVSQKLH